MRNLIILFSLLMIISCKTDDNASAFQTELIKLNLKTDFKPLKADDAYRFLNNYYLPRLDSLPYKRKLYIRQLDGKNFAALYKKESLILQQRFFGSKTNNDALANPPLKSTVAIPLWDSRKLNNVSIVTDSDVADISKTTGSVKTKLEMWTEKFGKGYVSISYPQYNVHTKRLLIREWFEDGGFCGTGMERFVYFKKIEVGWQPVYDDLKN